MEDIFKFIEEKLEQATALERSNETPLPPNQAVEAANYFSPERGGEENSPPQPSPMRDTGSSGSDSGSVEDLLRDYLPLEEAAVARESLRNCNATTPNVTEMPTTGAGTHGSENFEGQSQSAVTGFLDQKPSDSAVAPTFTLPSAQNRKFLAHSLLIGNRIVKQTRKSETENRVIVCLQTLTINNISVFHQHVHSMFTTEATGQIFHI